MKYCLNQDQTGFSLLEMVIGMSIGLIILAAISSTFITQRRVYDLQEQRLEMTQTARAALDVIIRDVMMGGYDPKGHLQRVVDTTSDYTGIVYHADELEIRADQDGDGIIVVDENGSTDPDDWDYDGRHERIQYRLDGDLLRRATNGGGFQPFAENVKNFSLRYLNDTGSDTINSFSIRQIEITVEVETEKAVMGTGFKKEKLVSVVEVRNMGLEI
jgi:prepilin-type N-terminal cleavage/methylation domain-containing protein